jgi:predicted aconitase
MELIVGTAECVQASSLIAIESAHVTSGFFNHKVDLDFAERLSSGGAKVAVRTTMNVGRLDLLHPELRRDESGKQARRLMELYEQMGCLPTWTCAPYQLINRPRFGENIAWSESNAVIFANSVLGARTNKYGTFIDICAALTGRVPKVGMHCDRDRRGDRLFVLRGFSETLVRNDVLPHLLGLHVGGVSGSGVPIIQGLASQVSEDQLKALGAAAATAGQATMFHVVGVTPEAQTLSQALQGSEPRAVHEIEPSDLRAERDKALGGENGVSLTAVCLGTPHFSIGEFAKLVPLLIGQRVHPGVRMYVSTSRSVIAEMQGLGWDRICEKAGATVVTDTCTYYRPIVDGCEGHVLTNAMKWAYQAPYELGARCSFGSMEECVKSAILGRIWRDERLWSDAMWSAV